MAYPLALWRQVCGFKSRSPPFMTISSMSTNIENQRITLRRHKNKLTLVKHHGRDKETIIDKEYQTEEKAKQKYKEVEIKIEEMRE